MKLHLFSSQHYIYFRLSIEFQWFNCTLSMIWLQKYFHKQFQLTSGPWYIFDRVPGFFRNIDLDEFMGVDSSFEQWRDWRLNNEISYSFLLLDWVDFVTLKCFLIELILSLWSVVFDCMANRSPNREITLIYIDAIKL